jgi:hypothetical protein
MTIKKRIIEYLSHGEWEDKNFICSQMSHCIGCYTDTIGRELRQLAEKGLILKCGYPDRKGTQYKLAYHEPLKATPKKIQYQDTLFPNRQNNG